MKTLVIDTSDNKQISVGLRIDNKEYIKRQKVDTTKAQAALPLIREILKEKDMAIEDIDAISVNTGPGSFTGLRVGIAIANALGFSLKVAVNGKAHFAQPAYK